MSVKKFFKILNIACAIMFSVTFVLVGYMLFVYFFSQRALLPVKEYEPILRLPYNIANCPYTKAEIKSKIEALYGHPFYFYAENNIWASGMTELITRRVIIDNTPRLSHYNYTYTIAHELAHITAISGDEAFATYSAITKLYESGDAYFVEVAKAFAMQNINNYGNNGAYECGYYLQEYFKKSVLN